jgi:hypothetical protein
LLTLADGLARAEHRGLPITLLGQNAAHVDIRILIPALWMNHASLLRMFGKLPVVGPSSPYWHNSPFIQTLSGTVYGQ